MVPSPRGVLFPDRLPTFTRLAAPAHARDLIVHLWIPEWSLPPGEVSRQHVLSHPSCNLVVEPGLVGLAGPTTRRSVRELTGTGWAVGARLRPAAVQALTSAPSALRDRYVPFDLPGVHAAVRSALEDATATPEQRRHRAADLLVGAILARCGGPTADGLLANRLAERIEEDPSVRSVADVAAALHVSERTVQRIAGRLIGVTPAAMIRRARLQAAAERLREDPDLPIATVAAELGYADHAHLTRDFRTVLGFSPRAYRGARGEIDPDGGVQARVGG